MNLPRRSRLSYIVPFLIAVTMLLFAGIAYISLSSASEEQVVSRVKALLLRRVNFAQTVLERGLQENDLLVMNRFISTTSASPDIVNILAIDDKGIVVASNDYAQPGLPAAALNLSIDQSAVDAAISTRSLKLVEDNADLTLTVYAPLCTTGTSNDIRPRACGFLFYRVNLAYDLESGRKLLLSQFGFTVAATLLIGFALALVLHRLVTIPARRLVHAATSYLSGDRSVRLNFDGGDELSTIGRALDSMLGQLAVEERQLRESKEQYLYLLDSMPIACVLMTGQQIRFANKAFSKLYRIDDTRTADFEAFIASTKLKRAGVKTEFPDLFLTLSDADALNAIDVEITLTNGNAIQALGYVRFLGADRREILIALVDVTEREQAREQLLLHSQVWEQSSDMLLVTELDGRVKDVNPAVERTLGLSKYEIIGKEALTLVGQQASEAEIERRRHIADTAGSITVDYTIATKNGRKSRIESTMLPLRNSAGAISSRLIISRDLSKEDERRLALRRFANLVSAAPDPIIGINQDSKIITCNPAACSAFGYAQDDLVGQPLSMLLPSALGSTHSILVRGFFSSSDSARSMAQLRTISGVRSDGQELKLQISLAGMEDVDGTKSAIAIIRDVTALEEMRSQLQQADKLSALGQLTGGIAHDFNNLLAAMLSSAELIQISSEPQSNTHVLGSRIVTMAQRGAALIRRLMVFSRKAEIHPEDLDISAVAREVVESLGRMLGSSIRVELEADTDPLYAHVDRSMLVSCLLNLSVNARDAMPSGGALRFKIAPLVEQAHSPRKEWVLITVSDTGEGMPEDVRRRIFEPFFTTKSAAMGTGLGLAMVYGFIKQSGGEIEVASTVGEGSQFLLRLPRLMMPIQTATLEPQAITNSQVGRGATVLLVEDNADVRDSMTIILEHLGCVVIEAETYQQAQDLIQEHSDIMAVICDYEIGPGQTGLDLAHWIRDSGYRIPGAIVSGYIKAESDQITSLGWKRLQKPVAIAELSALIQDLISTKGAAHSPSATSTSTLSGYRK